MKLIHPFWFILLFLATALLVWLVIYWVVMELLSSPIPPTQAPCYGRAWIEALGRTQ